MLVRADQGHFKQGQQGAVTRDITVQNHEVALDQKVCWWVGGDEPELTGVMVSADIAALQDSELSAKRRVVRLQRQLLTARTAHAMHQVGVVKQANVLAARAEMDRLLSRDITAGMVGEPPASEEGLRSLASQLQLKMNEMYSVVHNGVATKVSWYRLCAAATATATARCAAARSLCEFTLSLAPHRFKHMDDDESGLISYLEFQGMVREELLLGHKELPEKILKAAWLALDNDGSGRLTVGEFGQFMQLGGHEKRDSAEKAEARRKVIFEANKRAAQKVREEQEALKDAHIMTSMSGEAPATEEEVQDLASKLTDKMHQLFSTVHNGVKSKVSWFRLFKHMDDDASGLISYIEFAGMVREELLLDSHALPEKVLKKVWLALDDDGSGRLKVGEFGQFMQLGYRDLTTKAEARRKETHEANMRAAAAVKAEQDKLFNRDIARSMSGEAPATDEEVRDLATNLTDKMNWLFSTVHNGVKSHVTWFRLFKHMDDDASGLISYIEFAGMVREELLLDSHALPEKVLKKVWLALDDDGSGRLKVGEFGQFMQLGYRDLTTKAEARRKEIHEANMRAAAAVRAEEDKLFDRDIARSMSGEAPATEEEVCSPLFSKRFRPPALLLVLQATLPSASSTFTRLAFVYRW